ncbi:hypothetical protein C8J57DRAFT_1268515 [Mycena rebaudengoi]|nr:hypothetical protein C8J57DRAFT_1268515 [Mycena rebaudengoi]
MGKSNKRKRVESSEEEEEEEEGFSVEVITAARVADSSTWEDTNSPWEYHVKWAGYGSEDDSWEPAPLLAGCQRLLASFWENVGLDDRDYPVGEVLTPTDKWIRKERKRFAAENSNSKEEERKQKERADQRREAKYAAEKAKKKKQESVKQSASAGPSRSGSASVSARPFASSSKLSSSASFPVGPPKKKKKAIVPESSDSDDDQPLANLSRRKASINPKSGKSTMQDKGKKSTSATASLPTKKKSVSAEKEAKKSAPPSRAQTPPGQSSLFLSPSSPEISLSSTLPEPSKSKPPGRFAATSTSQSQSLPNISVNTDVPATSPTLPAAPRPMPPPPPKPTTPSIPAPPPPNKTRIPSSNNTGSASAFPPRPLPTKTSTPILSSAKSTPTIASAKPSASAIPSVKPTIPSAKSNTPIIPPAKTTLPLSKNSTPTIPSAIPAHLQPKAAPPSRGVQAMNTGVPQQMGSGSGLSTKQRLASMALEAVKPTREAPPKKSLASLSFKKNSGSSAPTASGSTSRVKNPPPQKRPVLDPLFDDPYDDPPNVEMDDAPIGTYNDPSDRSMLPPALSRRTSSHTSFNAKPNLNTQTDDFLKAIMPTRLAAPLTETMEKQGGPAPPRPIGGKPQLPQARIKKKWKWTGPLLADVADKTDHICDVVLNDPVPSEVDGLSFNLAMTAATSIHLLSFHDLIDMSEFLRSCVSMMAETRPIISKQLARLGPNADKDAEPLKTIARFMIKRDFVSLIPVPFDGDLVGHIIFFPPVMKVLNNMFNVPLELQSSSLLIAALLTWKPFQQEARRSFSLLPSRLSPPLPKAAERRLLPDSKYQLALRILKFPLSLHQWMSISPNRMPRPKPKSYCIWGLSSEGKGPQDRETAYLVSILNHCKAVRVGFKAEIRAVFVHVGAVKSIHKMPYIVDRRGRTCSVHFYTYGTHETVHPEHWGVYEIYPVGGVVTFTPNALYEDPWGVINKMKIISQHPLWTCYLLPSVLGLATKLSTADEDPLAAFDRGVFVFELLLKAIDDGEVSLLRAPPLGRNPTLNSDPMAAWMRDHWVTRPLGPRRILELCVNTFSAKYSNVPSTRWSSMVEAEISEDLSLMQIQPHIMKQYRRFVVIKAGTDTHISGDRDGFEWVTGSAFLFNDDSPGQKEFSKIPR